MRAWKHRHAGNWFAGGAQATIAGFAAQTESPAVWPYALAAIALISFAAWMGNYRRLRHIADTPTSNVTSAAQGYVELHGRGEAPGGAPLLSRLSSLPCIWYRYEVYKKTLDNKWALEDSGESDEPFLLRDATGVCVVDPEGAEVICDRKKSWTAGNRRHHEWMLLPNDTIYALGEFVTMGGANSSLDLNADVATLLAEWKKNQARLLERFDLDKSGILDMKEWELARRQARREIEAQHAEVRSQDGTHVMRKPAHRALYLISNHLPDKLCRRYQLWSWAHVVLFVAALVAAVTLL